MKNNLFTNNKLDISKFAEYDCKFINITLVICFCKSYYLLL